MIKLKFNSFLFIFSSSSCISEFFDAREYASHSDDSSDEEEDNEIEDDENEANSTDDEQVSYIELSMKFSMKLSMKLSMKFDEQVSSFELRILKKRLSTMRW